MGWGLDINDFKHAFFNQESLDFFSNDYPEQIKCIFSVDSNHIKVMSQLDRPSNICSNRGTVELFHDSELFEAKITISIIKHNFLSFEGSVREVVFDSKKHKPVNKIIYLIAGTESYFIHNNFSWKRTYKLKSKSYTINYSFILNRICAQIDEGIMSDEDEFNEISNNIDNEVFVICQSYSFCRSSKVEWVEKAFYSDKDNKLYHYISSNAPSKFYNMINPMRSDNRLWNNFIQHVTTKNITKEQLLDKQVFQAINNIIWNGTINEWTLIAHAAALESLCKNTEFSVIETKEYKRVRRFLMNNLSENLNKFNISEDCFNTIKQNICNNDRTLNGYPTKWYIKQELERNGLEKYSCENLSKISKAIGMRNVIVHEGWSDDWDSDIYEYIKILRDTICLIIFSFYDYSGEFYLLNDNDPVSLSDYH